jgi:hypothetical protein
MFLSRWNNGSSFSFLFFCSVENRKTKEILKKQKRIHFRFEREKACGSAKRLEITINGLIPQKERRVGWQI